MSSTIGPLLPASNAPSSAIDLPRAPCCSSKSLVIEILAIAIIGALAGYVGARFGGLNTLSQILLPIGGAIGAPSLFYLIKSFCSSECFETSRGYKGFPNPSQRNCSYNSAGIVFAWTNIGDHEIQRITAEEEHFSQHQENEERRALETLKMRASDIEIQLHSLHETHQKHLQILSTYSPKLQEMQRSPLYQYRNEDYAGNQVQEFIKRLEDLNTQISKQQMAMYANESDQTRLENERSTILREIQQKERILGEHQTKLAACVRARQTLRIARGEEEGRLTEAEARDLYRLLQLPAGKVFQGNNPTISWEKELEQRLLDPQLRVIRVGGGGHYWAMVKNSRGTFDVVNDESNGIWIDGSWKTCFSSEEIVDRWGNPDEFRHSQIELYSNASST